MLLKPNARAEIRWNRYKVAVDAEEGRRQREDKMVEIRKSKREESLLKKRREGLQARQFPSSVHTTTVEKKLGSHTKKRPDNLVIGQTYDHHIYDLIELGVENFKSMQSFSYDKKIAPLIGTKPFFAFIGEGFENVEELKHLKEILLDLFRGQQVVTNLNLVGLD